MRLLLDTCVLVWSIAEPEAISTRGRDHLVAANAEVLFSPISCAELACAVERGRIELDRHWKLWFRHYVELNQWRGADISLDVIEEAYSLPGPFHRDPADRILVATARLLSCAIVTADRKILDYPHVKTIW